MKKSNLIMIVVTISMFVVLLLGATYAYFASNTNVGNGLDMTITTDNNNIAFAATEGTLSMHVKAEDMLQSQTGNGSVLAAETVGEDNIVITLSTNTETPIACTYNVYFQWNTNQAYINGAELVQGDAGYNQWYPERNILNELTLELNLEDEDGNGREGINPFALETQMTKVITSTSKTKVVNGAFIVGSSSNSGTQEWIPTIRFYNLAKDQSALAGKTFGGKFTVEDVVCNSFEPTSIDSVVTGSLSAAVLGLQSNSEYTSSQDSSKYIVKQEYVVHEGQILNAGVRYEGKEPDNYVEFNDEEWRIIGTFEGSTIGLEPKKYYTKIIRILPMNMAFDSGQTEDNWDGAYDFGEQENDWTNSTLNTYLNGEYLQGLTDKTKIAKYNGNYSTWHLRGLTEDEHYSATTSDWYLAERITGGTGYRNGVLGDADEIIQSAIAIMYPSDYGYAAYGEGCSKEATTLYRYGTIEDGEVLGCAGVDWLLLEEDLAVYEWLLSPALQYSYAAFNVQDLYVNYFMDSGVDCEYFVRPVLYLEADVKIAGGNGSNENPYKLS